MVVEVIGGILANSLAIATDAAHLLTDLASFMVSLFSIWLASRPSTQRMSFGWHRAEVIILINSVGASRTVNIQMPGYFLTKNSLTIE